MATVFLDSIETCCESVAVAIAARRCDFGILSFVVDRLDFDWGSRKFWGARADGVLIVQRAFRRSHPVHSYRDVPYIIYG